MNSVRSSSPLSCSARTIDATPSSTASSDSSRWRYISVMPLIRAAPSNGRRRIAAGLSDTSASLNAGVRGIGSLANRLR